MGDRGFDLFVLCAYVLCFYDASWMRLAKIAQNVRPRCELAASSAELRNLYLLANNHKDMML
jgi:hypothetical protein